MTALGLALAVLLIQGSELPLDCGRPDAGTTLIGQTRLSEIEWAEDVSREAMWEAFGRCAASPGAEACREEARRRFGAELEAQKATIREKYGKLLTDFLERCLASIT